MTFALKFARSVLNCTKGMLWVIDIRTDILDWYKKKFGFQDTGQRIPFPSANESVGQPRPEIVEKFGWLQFAVLTRSLDED